MSLFFLFKQKTAYEMRISDWSSDVCSSDLAATLQNRYGWKVGVPAQIVAAFVGLSRVEARKHHVHDVLVGAAIGEASGFLITRRANDRIQVFPWGDTKGGGVAVTMRF